MTVGVVPNWPNLGVAGRVEIDQLVLDLATPASATAAGIVGTICFDAS